MDSCDVTHLLLIFLKHFKFDICKDLELQDSPESMAELDRGRHGFPEASRTDECHAYIIGLP